MQLVPSKTYFSPIDLPLRNCHAEVVRATMPLTQSCPCNCRCETANLGIHESHQRIARYDLDGHSDQLAAASQQSIRTAPDVHCADGVFQYLCADFWFAGFIFIHPQNQSRDQQRMAVRTLRQVGCSTAGPKVAPAK